VSDVFLFPGQGLLPSRMGGESLRRQGPVRTLLERASSALGMDLAGLIAAGSVQLAKTEVGQPAVVAFSLGLALELEASGVQAVATAGHSLGEVAAFSFAGCLEPEEAIDCVLERGRLMASAVRQRPGGMAAVLVSTETEVQAALAFGATAGRLELAAHNSPHEWVLTGDDAALRLVGSRFETVPLRVAGPWHSQAMAEVSAAWRRTLARRTWRRPRIRLVANVTGRAVVADDDLVEVLVGQLTRPVRWAETMQTLRAGTARWHVFGHGRALRALCRANLGERADVRLHDGFPRRECMQAPVERSQAL
jgi:[acyl-carrier-protein] S-malonyltransferase